MKELVFVSAAQAVGNNFTIEGRKQISSVHSVLNEFMQNKKAVVFHSGAADAESTAMYLKKNGVEGVNGYRGMSFLNHTGNHKFYREMQDALSCIRPPETDTVIMVAPQILIDNYINDKIKEFNDAPAARAATIIVMDAGTDTWDKTSRNTWARAAVKSVIIPK